MVEPHGVVAAIGDDPHGMGDDDDRRPALAKLMDVVEALALEVLVADRDHLVDHQDLRSTFTATAKPRRVHTRQ